MNLSKDKKISKGWLHLFLYLSFCCVNWYESRAIAAQYLSVYATAYSQMGIVSELLPFFLCGIFPYFAYRIIINIIAHSLKNTPFLPVDQMVSSLPVFYAAGNLVAGLISIVYYFYPIVSVWGSIIVPVVTNTVAFALFLVYMCRNYVKKYNWKVFIIFFGRLYVVFGALFLAVELLMGAL